MASPGYAASQSPPVKEHTTRDTRYDWPSANEVASVLLLRDYNTRLVVLSTAALGLAAGLVGSFLLLRKRSLMGDALSHATLPGICIAFMVMVAFGGSGKALSGLLLGAVVFGLAGVGCVIAIRNLTRIKDDAAMGIVLSVFFGLGVALLGVIEQLPTGNQAGLEGFIYGKTASMIKRDFYLVVVAAVGCAAAGVAFYKEFKILCFDEGFAKSQGWPTLTLDILMLGLVTAVTVIGLQAVGLILVLALLIIPPAAARFWTHRLHRMMLMSAAMGVFCGWLGATASALAPRMPAGAVIVVVAAVIFALSMLFGPARGVAVRMIRHRRLRARIQRQHLLRAFYELNERRGHAPTADQARATLDQLTAMRSWSRHAIRRSLRSARRAGLLSPLGSERYKLTPTGLADAARLVRNHRLWEMYLITYADIAPCHVDRDADQVEHVLGSALVMELEDLMDARNDPAGVHPPISPHAIS